MSVSDRRRSFWREPLFHFLVIGAIVFGAHAVWQAHVKRADRTIVVSSDELQRLTTLWAGEAGRSPTPDDVRGLLAEYVREEVLYREAQRLGLDQDDTIIRRRLAQKMSFLIERDEPADPLSEEDLRAAYERNPDAYAQPARVSLRHVPFNFDQSGASREAEIAASLKQLQEDEDAKPSQLGDPFMLSRVHANLSEVEMARLFGRDFASAVFDAPTETWQGPIRSRLADHLVYVDRKEPGGVPPFETIIEDVRAREIARERQADNDAELARLLERYTVILDDETS